MSEPAKPNRIAPKPERRAPATVAEFVTGKEPTKRLTIDLPEGLHRRAKLGAVNEGKTMADLVRELLEGRFPS